MQRGDGAVDLFFFFVRWSFAKRGAYGDSLRQLSIGKSSNLLVPIVESECMQLLLAQI